MVDMPDDEATRNYLGEAEETTADEDSASIVEPTVQSPAHMMEETISEEDSTSIVKSLGDELVSLQSDNMSFYQANKAYHEARNYEEAIKEFEASIEYERSQGLDLESLRDKARRAESNEVVAKSMYWMGESYLKMNQMDSAFETFERLARHFRQHYLGLAARRRIAALKADNLIFREESESV